MDSSPLNFLELIPARAIEHMKQDWQVGFEVPRFKSKFWRKFFTLLGASETYIARLDRMGSEIWGYINGKRTVSEILARLELSHPKEENLKERLIHYLKRLDFHKFIVMHDQEDITRMKGN